MKVLILAQLERTPMGGYDFIKFFNKKYNLLFSSGTIYSCLYSMERNGLVAGLWDRKRRIYRITEKGRAMLNEFRKDKEKMIRFISNILK
jgi:DNA-binding PadR family transcriptional regulator